MLEDMKIVKKEQEQEMKQQQFPEQAGFKNNNPIDKAGGNG